MRRKTFTLVEILVVIAVIGILMGLLFPALGVIREKASMRQSLTEAKAIHMAVKSFKNEYSYLPDSTTGNDIVYYGSKAKSTTTTTDEKCSDVFKMDESLQTDYLDLFNTLCYGNSDPTTNNVPPDGAKTLNPKKIKFLEPGKKFIGAATERGYRDPWGRPYVIFLDTNYDGKITLPGSKEIYDDVAVLGQGTYEYEKDKTASDKLAKALAKPEQIVTSWQ